jgi:glycosyltransferase involved in cell wall biosynthesis
VANVRIPSEKAHGYQICKMCEEFSNRGAEVELWVPVRKGDIKEGAISFYGLKNNFKIRRINSSDFYRYRESPGKLSFWLQSFWFVLHLMFIEVDKDAIIYTRDAEIGWVFRLRGRKTVFEAHNWPSKGWLYKFLIGRGSKNNKVVSITSGLGGLFLKNNWPENKILVAPDGVDLEKFDIDLGKESARKNVGLPIEKKIIMYTGHLYGWKGADVLADAAAHLREHLIVFVGGIGPEFQDFKEKYKNCGNIKIVSFQKRGAIPFYLKAADVLVLPNKKGEKISEEYTSPLKLFEYMASKRPIIASDLPSIREVLNEKNAILFEPDNSELLASGIKKLIQDSVFSQRIANQAWLDVQKYSWSERVKKILEFILL